MVLESKIYNFLIFFHRRKVDLCQYNNNYKNFEKEEHRIKKPSTVKPNEKNNNKTNGKSFKGKGAWK